MRVLIAFIALIGLSASPAHAETPLEFETLGANALKLSQTEPDAIVTAALNYGKASELYEKSGDDTKATEMNSFLYWCKKKMTLQQMDVFLKGDSLEAAAVAKKLKALDAAAPANEAQAYFDRAESFAQAHPEEQLLIAIRFFEVADRFKGDEWSLKAQDRSLTAMQAALKNPSAPTRPEPAQPPAPAAPIVRVPVPKPDALKAAEKTIRDIFKDDFARATTPSSKLTLARKLDKEAQESASDPAGKYELLVLAAGFAAQGGDLKMVLHCGDEVERDFLSDGKDFRKLSLAALPASADPVTVKAAAAYRTLLDRPDDSTAQLNVGRYLAFVKHNWDEAAPHLAIGAKGALKILIEHEQPLKEKGDAQIFMGMGDEWFDAAAKESDKNDAKAFQERAAYWYSRALPDLSGLSKIKAEKRGAHILPPPGDPGAAQGGGPPVPVAPANGNTIDLMVLIDPAKDTLSGKFRFNEVQRIMAISEKGMDCATLRLPYEPPEEYDFSIKFRRKLGSDFILQHFPVQGKPVTWVMSSHLPGGGKIFTGLGGGENLNIPLENNHTYTSLVQVRKDTVTVFLDGKFAAQMSSPYTFGSPGRFKLDDPKYVGISAYKASETGALAIFDEIKIIETNGSGKKRR